MKIILNLINAVAATAYSGFVFSVMWGWFIVTTFGLAPLSLAAAIGVILCVRYITFQVNVRDTDDENTKFQNVMFWVKPTLFLATGFVVQLFM